jgi:lipoprotein-anchoring transpeptidase ErfK/SrfK
MFVRAALAIFLGFTTFAQLGAQEPRKQAIEIDLQEQIAYLIEDGQVALEAPISTGRAGHFTETGAFKIIEKERNHYSNMYGKIVDARGNTVTADADADMAVPPGGRFVPAPMRYFLRFNGAIGMHAGYLPGYPASHGCVRLPEGDAIALFNSVEVGTPVTVFGTTRRSRAVADHGWTMRSRRQEQFRSYPADQYFFRPFPRRDRGL